MHYATSFYSAKEQGNETQSSNSHLRSRKSFVAGYGSFVAGEESCVAGHGSYVARQDSYVADHRLLVADNTSCVASWKSYVADKESCVASEESCVADWKSCVAALEPYAFERKPHKFAPEFYRQMETTSKVDSISHRKRWTRTPGWRPSGRIQNPGTEKMARIDRNTTFRPIGGLLLVVGGWESLKILPIR